MYNVNTANSTWFDQNKNIFNFKNVVLFLRTFLTQMRTSDFSLCNIYINFLISENDRSVNKTFSYKTFFNSFLPYFNIYIFTNNKLFL